MQIVTLERGQTTKLFWVMAGLFAAVIVFTGRASDPVVLATALLLAVVSIYPFYLWMLGSSRGLPVWPVFSLMNGGLAVLPMVQNLPQLRPYSAAEISFGGITMIGFLVLGTAVWLSLSSRPLRPPAKVSMIAREHSERYLLLFLLAGALYEANRLGGWVSFPGNLEPVVRSLTGALSSMGIFILSFYKGRGLLTKQATLIFISLITFILLSTAASLMLATSIVPAALAVLGYTLGANRLPWRTMAMLFVAISLFHAGKWEMRSIYWGEGSEALRGENVRRLTPAQLPAFFSEWIGYGLKELGGLGGALQAKTDEDATSQTVFERAGVMHLLLLVQKKSPNEVPFLDGATYAPIPRLLIPRFIDPEKGITHAANMLLSVNYGVLTLEGSQTTSVGWGLVAEAYANFGLLGVGMLAIVLGAFYAWIGNLTVGVPLTSLRFVIGLLVMAGATKADTLAIFVTMQFQGIMGVVVASYFLMKRQTNPFAAEGGEGIRHTGNGIRHAAYGMRREDGMPAPGVLAGLIEGAPEGRAQHGAWSMEHGVEPSRAKQLAADGGVVRTMPIRMPKRIASWMPRRMRAAVVAQQRAAAQADGIRHEADGEAEAQTADGKRHTDSGRPRQLAVPYQNYRRYRG